MLEEAMNYPELVIGSDTLSCGYDPKRNIIRLACTRGEEDALFSMLHENDHWAQLMFLDKEERDEVFRVYRCFVGPICPAPFLEKVNFWPSQSWMMADRIAKTAYNEAYKSFFKGHEHLLNSDEHRIGGSVWKDLVPK